MDNYELREIIMESTSYPMIGAEINEYTKGEKDSYGNVITFSISEMEDGYLKNAYEYLKKREYQAKRSIGFRNRKDMKIQREYKNEIEDLIDLKLEELKNELLKRDLI